MIKTMFLVPEKDNRGRRFPAAAWRELEERLLDFGGYSEARGVRGAWTAGDRVYRDVSRQYIVALASWTDLPRWLEVVRWAKERFEQEAIYIEVAGVPEILE